MWHTLVMRKRSRGPKRDDGSADVIDIASRVLRRTIAFSEEPTKDPIAVELGRRGGLKGGKARAAKMTPEERRASALKAVRARWAKQKS